MAEPIRESEGSDELVEPVGVGTSASQLERQEDVLPGGERRDQVEGLEDEAEPFAAQQRALLVGETDHVDPGHLDLAGVDGVECRHAVHQRGLAGAGRPHDCGEGARGELDGHAVERADPRVAGAVGLGDVTGLRGECP